MPKSLSLLTEDENENLAALGKLALCLWRARPVDPDALSAHREADLDFEELRVEIQRHQRPDSMERPSTDVWDLRARLRDLAPDLTAPQQDQLVALLVEGWDSEFSRRNRIAVVEVLGDIGPGAAPAVPLISRELQESEDAWRRYMTEGVGDAAPGNLVALYLELVSRFDRMLDLRLAAADALGRIGPAARDSSPLLQRLVEEAEPTLRYVAARSLRLIGRSADE